MRRNPVLVCLAVLLLSVACGDDDGDKGPPPVRVGDSCTQDGVEACVGNTLVECKFANNVLRWELDNDCAAQGQTCVMSSSVEGRCQ